MMECSCSHTVQVAVQVEDAEKFIDAGIGAQRNQAKYLPLAITATLIQDRKTKLEVLCNPIVNKIAPKVEPPKPKEEAPKETATVTESAPETPASVPASDLD